MPDPRWLRANHSVYRSRASCQRACDWLNHQFDYGEWWHEPVIAEDGKSFELWRRDRDLAWIEDAAS